MELSMAKPNFNNARCICLVHNYQVHRAKLDQKITDIVDLLPSVSTEIKRSTLRRLLEVGSTKTWPVEIRRRLAADVASHFHLNEAELFAYLLSAAEPSNRRIIELCHARLFRDNTRNLGRLAEQLHDRVANAKEIRCIHNRLPPRYATKKFWAGVVQRDQIDNGYSDSIRESKIAFGAEMRKSEEASNSQYRLHFGLSLSAYKEMLSSTGHCYGLDPDCTADCLETFGERVVLDRDTSFYLFDDVGERMHADLKAWSNAFNVVLCVDSNFIMQISRNEIDRCFFERTGDPANDMLVDEQVRRINAVLAVTTHDVNDRAAMMRILEPDGVYCEAEHKAIYQRKAAEAIERDYNRPSYRVSRQ
jgi:hypothetical protein